MPIPMLTNNRPLPPTAERAAVPNDPQDERGANLAEYAFILALVTVLSIPFMTQIGSKVFSFFASYMQGIS